MLLVEELDAKSPGWDDPLVSIHRDQLSQVIDQVDRLRDLRWQQTGAAELPVKFAAQICEFSREAIFRIHRVTRPSASQLKDVIGRAVVSLRALISEMNAASPALAAQTEKISSYALHIERRQQLLDGLLKGTGQSGEAADDL